VENDISKILELNDLCDKGNSLSDLSASTRTAKDRKNGMIMLLSVAILFLATQVVGGWMIRKARPHQDPSVFPLLPCVLVARDRTGYVGELTVYVWYFCGVRQIGKTRLWIS